MSSCKPHGWRVEGNCENERNQAHAELYERIICEAFGVTKAICGHHLIYLDEKTKIGEDGHPYTYTFPQEIPSADALIFNHDVARKIWGNEWRANLTRLALEPVETRDKLLAKLYYGRKTALSVRYGGNEELEFRSHA